MAQLLILLQHGSPAPAPRANRGVVMRCATATTLFASLCVVAAQSLSAQNPTSSPHQIEVESVVLSLMTEADLAAQEAGLIVAVDVEDGSRVDRGERIAQIDDRVARVAKEAATLELQVAAAKAESDLSRKYAAKAHAVAVSELARSEETNRKYPGSVSQSQLDVERLTTEKTDLEQQQALQDVKILSLERAVKQHQVQATQLQIDRRRVISPFRGTIAETLVQVGEWVEPGQKIARLVSINRLRAEGFLPAHLASNSLVGSKVKVEARSNSVESKAADPSQPDGNPTITYGVVRFVSPEMDPITGQVRVWAEIDNRQQHFRPGEQVAMLIVPKKGSNT